MEREIETTVIFFNIPLLYYRFSDISEQQMHALPHAASRICASAYHSNTHRAVDSIISSK